MVRCHVCGTYVRVWLVILYVSAAIAVLALLVVLLTPAK
jgi:hypothetical protein